MKHISFTPSSRHDLKLIYEFIGKDNASAARKHLMRLQKRWRALLDQPRMGTKRDDIRTGMRSVTEGNYVIFYRAVDSGIEIIRVLHSSMDTVRAFKQAKD